MYPEIVHPLGGQGSGVRALAKDPTSQYGVKKQMLRVINLLYFLRLCNEPHTASCARNKIMSCCVSCLLINSYEEITKSLIHQKG